MELQNNNKKKRIKNRNIAIKSNRPWVNLQGIREKREKE